MQIRLYSKHVLSLSSAAKLHVQNFYLCLSAAPLSIIRKVEQYIEHGVGLGRPIICVRRIKGESPTGALLLLLPLSDASIEEAGAIQLRKHPVIAFSVEILQPRGRGRSYQCSLLLPN
jgi:hypothetical protein